MSLSKTVETVLKLSQNSHNDRQPLRDFLKGLSENEIYWLGAIYLFGQGATGHADIERFYQDFCRTNQNSVDMAVMFLSERNLHEMIGQGVKLLHKGRIDIDTLPNGNSYPLASVSSGDGIELQLGSWHCDKCGEIIERSANGAVVWLTRILDNNYRKCIGRNLQIVHSPRGDKADCFPSNHSELDYDQSCVKDIALDEIKFPKDLIALLQMVEDGIFTALEVKRMICRLFVPGYEQARFYFDDAVEFGVVSSGVLSGELHANEMKRILANIPKIEAERKRIKKHLKPTPNSFENFEIG